MIDRSIDWLVDWLIDWQSEHSRTIFCQYFNNLTLYYHIVSHSSIRLIIFILISFQGTVASGFGRYWRSRQGFDWLIVWFFYLFVHLHFRMFCFRFYFHFRFRCLLLLDFLILYLDLSPAGKTCTNWQMEEPKPPT